MALSPGPPQSILLSLMLPPMLIEGFGAFGMTLHAFMTAAKALRGASIKCVSGHLKLIDANVHVWSGRLDTIELVAILRPSGMAGRVMPRMLLIQTSETADGGGPLWRPSSNEHDPPYLGASSRSILLPGLFDISAYDIARRIADGSQLAACEHVKGVPNSLRVVQAWSRSEKANVQNGPIYLQRWRMFTGVCPVCRTHLPVLKWFSMFSNRACHQCGTSLRRHASRFPVALTTALTTSMLMLILNRWFSLDLNPVAYRIIFIVVFFVLGYYLVRIWSRYSAEVQSGNYCRECGYDLRGCTDQRCSECGTPTSDNSDCAPKIAKDTR